MMDSLGRERKLADYTAGTWRKMTSCYCQCDVITSHRRQCDVILAPNAHWVVYILCFFKRRFLKGNRKSQRL